MHVPARVMLLLAALLAACASPAAAPTTDSGGAPITTPSAEPTPVPTPTLEPSPDLAAFGETYLALVSGYNNAVCDFTTVANDPNHGRPQLMPVAEALASAIRTFTEGARAVDWPADVQESIDDLVRATAAQEAHLRVALEAQNDQAFFDNLNRAFEASAEGAGPAQLIRVSLGLEGIPGNACDA